MRRIFVVMFLSLTLLMALGSVAAAHEGDHPPFPGNERACVGAGLSGFAREVGGVGPFISVVAKEFQPLGSAISTVARTCEFSEE